MLKSSKRKRSLMSSKLLVDDLIELKFKDIPEEDRPTAKDIALAIGVQEKTLSNYRRNRVDAVRLSTINKICRYLECHPRDLWGWEDE